MKYFVTSDIHGFFDEFLDALKQAGFDETNEEHCLILCGDAFDRGSQPLEIYNYLKVLPRKILVRGNHEILLKDLYERKQALYHDYSNGTVDTIAAFAGLPSQEDFKADLFKTLYTNSETEFNYAKVSRLEKKRKQRLFHNAKTREVLRWIASDDWVNYYEMDDFIFVHSFIPTIIKEEASYKYDVPIDMQEYDSNWRDADQERWNEAMWGCPWKKAKAGLNQTGKTIVCGHWHTSDFYNHLNYEKEPDKWLNYETNNPIYLSSTIIGLDACTAATRGVNVLVIDGNKLELHSHNEGQFASVPISDLTLKK